MRLGARLRASVALLREVLTAWIQQQALALLLGGNNTTYGGNFELTLTETTVPEPKFTLLSAIALVGLALASSRLRRS